MLIPAATPAEAGDNEHPNGATWELQLPKPQSDAEYAGFRIVGTPGNAREKDGLLIAMTPLDGNAP